MISFHGQYGTSLESTNLHDTTIPSRAKHDAKLYATGQILDDEFLNTIKYLVKIHAIK